MSLRPALAWRRSFWQGPGRHQLNRPIWIRPAARRAVMPCDEIDGRGLGSVCNGGGAEDYRRSYRLGVAAAAAPDSRPNRLGNVGNATRSRTPASPIGGASYEIGAGASRHFWAGTEREQGRSHRRGHGPPVALRNAWPAKASDWPASAGRSDKTVSRSFQ
jgi:hypothetical protein